MSCPHGNPIGCCDICDEVDAAFEAGKRSALAEQPAQHEPVAQWQKKHAARTDGKWENTNEHDAKWWHDNAQGWEIRALYTTPQAQRTWVGLTRKEVHDLYDSDYAVFHQRIEAKLKEKNT
jgi:hypothetical protein